MLRRIPQTVAFNPVFDEFGLPGPLLDIVEDLIGPDIRFHHSQLNFKSAGGGEAFKWRQVVNLAGPACSCKSCPIRTGSAT
jgi:hypothetical protein